MTLIFAIKYQEAFVFIFNALHSLHRCYYMNTGQELWEICSLLVKNKYSNRGESVRFTPVKSKWM